MRCCTSKTHSSAKRGRPFWHWRKIPKLLDGWETPFVAPNSRIPIVHDGNILGNCYPKKANSPFIDRCFHWPLDSLWHCYTLWLCQNSYGKWPFIVDIPIKNDDSPRRSPQVVGSPRPCLNALLPGSHGQITLDLDPILDRALLRHWVLRLWSTLTESYGLNHHIHQNW